MKKKDDRDCPKCGTRMEEVVELRDGEYLYQCPKCKTVDVVYSA